jgi:hypothetical protein
MKVIQLIFVVLVDVNIIIIKQFNELT